MRIGRLLGSSVVLVAFVLLLADVAQAQYAGNLKQAPYVYADPFPIFGKRLAKRGVVFPLPWGVGLNYMFVQQPITISNIELGANDSPMVDVSNFVKFKSVESKVHAINARVDLWLFPFLNVYGMVNYAPLSSTKVVLSEPFALNAGADQWVVGEGFGATGAFGAFGAWATLDVNWTWNQLQLIDTPVRTTLLTPRVGWKAGQWNKVILNLWIGAMAQFIGSETSGAIKLSEAIGTPNDEFHDKVSAWYDGLSRAQQLAVQELVDKLNGADLGDTTIKYKLDKKVTQRWNMLIGAQLEINKYWFLRLEAGFIKRESFLIGVNYRFGTPGLSNGRP